MELEVMKSGKQVEVNAKLDFGHKYVKSIVALSTLYMLTKFGYHQITRYQKRSRAKQQGDTKRQQLSVRHKCLDLYTKMIKPDTASLILSLSATAIRQHIIAGKLTCAEVMMVICHRTDQCNVKLNAILEAHYDTAYAEAVALDKVIKLNRKDKSTWNAFIASKPMLGIPLSIKDLFAMKNSDCTLGILRKCNEPYLEDGNVLQWVRNCGGIPFVKTNVPQLNMLPETINTIVGHCNNPYNLDRVVGGSSGGEGALIASGCSKLGIGTDIGGSIRGPAHFSGCIGYKPSSRRCPQTGKGLIHRDSWVSKCGIRAAMGPMAMDMDDIILFLKSMWSPSTMQMFQLDPYMAPMPFRNDIFESKRKLKIGYWYDDGWFSSTQCVRRAIDETLDILSSEYQYEIVEVPYSKAPESVNVKLMLEIYYKFISAEGPMVGFIDDLQDTEDLAGGFQAVKRLAELPMFCRRWLFQPVLNLLGEQRKSQTLDMTKNVALTVKEYRECLYRMMKFKYDFWQWMDQFEVDVVITPTDFYPAPPHEFSAEFLASLTCRFLQNILDCAAGTYGPVTFVREDECHYELEDIPEMERDKASRMLNEFMKDAEGLPVGVQLFAKPYDDEVVLRVMNDLDSYFKRKGLKNRGKLECIHHGVHDSVARKRKVLGYGLREKPILLAEDKAAWSVADFAKVSDSDYILQISDDGRSEIESALVSFKQHIEKNGFSLDTTSPDFDLNALLAAHAYPDMDMFRSEVFPLPKLGRELERFARQNLEDGLGFFKVKGVLLPKTYGNSDSVDYKLALWGLGRYVGRGEKQDKAGNLIHEVKDSGQKWGDNATVRQQLDRLYQTSHSIPFHTDGCDAFALYCLQQSQSGGLSILASAVAAFSAIAETRPDLAKVLQEDFYFDARGQHPDGLQCQVHPVFTYFKGKLSIIYKAPYIESAQRFDDVPKLTPLQREALAVFEEVQNSDELVLKFMLESGDIVFCSNHSLVHGRTAYEDSGPANGDRENKAEDGGSVRHCLRLWLTLPFARELPPHYAKTREYIYTYERRMM